jgi:hypothetical protein
MARSRDGINWTVMGHIRPEGTASSHVPEVLVLKQGADTWLYLFYAWKPAREEGKPWDYRYKSFRYIRKKLSSAEMGE